MMKVTRYLLLISFSCFIAFTSKAQLCFPVKRVYAYFQPVTAGIMSKEEAKNRNERGNYYIYIVSKKPGITLDHVFVAGESHHAELREVATPLTVPGSNVVLPGSRWRTYQLIFTAAESHAPRIGKRSDAAVKIKLKYKKRTKLFATGLQKLDIQPLQ